MIIRIKLYRVLFVLFISIFLTACGDSTVTAQVKRDIRGQLIDSKVIGIEYHCGAVVDFTDENGVFRCESLPISFYIGKINLGGVLTIPSDGKVFPQDILGVNRLDVNNSEVLKLALLLQSLDDDGDISTSITISNNLKIETEKTRIEDMSIEDIGLLLDNLGKTPIPLEDVKKHLRDNLPVITPIPSPSPSPTPTATPIPTPTATPIPIAIPSPTPIPTPIPTLTNPNNSEENSSIEYKNIFINDANCSQIIDNEFILICYDYRLKAAKSVAYHLYGDLMNDPNIDERPSFYVEKSIDKQYRVSTTDYINSNYDRGHLAPDAAFDWSDESLHAVYTLANIIPQAPQVNRNMWSQVEKYSRDKAVELGELDVINVVKYGKESKRIGKDKMAVSKGFYKVLYNKQDSYEECFYYVNKLNLSSLDDNISKHRIDCDTVSY